MKFCGVMICLIILCEKTLRKVKNGRYPHCPGACKSVTFVIESIKYKNNNLKNKKNNYLKSNSKGGLRSETFSKMYTKEKDD